MFHKKLQQKYCSKITFEDVLVWCCCSAGSAWIESWIAFGYRVGSSGGAHKKIRQSNRSLLTGPQTRWNAVLARFWIQFSKLENEERNAREHCFTSFHKWFTMQLFRGHGSLPAPHLREEAGRQATRVTSKHTGDCQAPTVSRPDQCEIVVG